MEFMEKWDDPKTKELFDRAVAALKPEKFVRNRTLVVQLNRDLMKIRNSEEPFDAVVEWWWKGTLQLNPQLETAEAQTALKALLAHQKTFVDFDRSPSFFTTG
jgi:hypothetical protein